MEEYHRVLQERIRETPDLDVEVSRWRPVRRVFKGEEGCLQSVRLQIAKQIWRIKGRPELFSIGAWSFSALEVTCNILDFNP